MSNLKIKSVLIFVILYVSAKIYKTFHLNCLFSFHRDLKTNNPSDFIQNHNKCVWKGTLQILVLKGKLSTKKIWRSARINYFLIMFIWKHIVKLLCTCTRLNYTNPVPQWWESTQVQTILSVLKKLFLCFLVHSFTRSLKALKNCIPVIK